MLPITAVVLSCWCRSGAPAFFSSCATFNGWCSVCCDVERSDQQHHPRALPVPTRRHRRIKTRHLRCSLRLSVFFRPSLKQIPSPRSEWPATTKNLLKVLTSTHPPLTPQPGPRARPHPPRSTTATPSRHKTKRPEPKLPSCDLCDCCNCCMDWCIETICYGP